MKTFITETEKNKKSEGRVIKELYVLIGIILVLTGWSILAYFKNDIIISSPWDTFSCFFKMILEKEFWHVLSVTFFRFLLGLIFGSFFGGVFGLICGLNEKARLIFEPLRWIISSVPPVVLVVLSMIFFGMGNLQTIFVTSLMSFPIVYINTQEGIKGLDHNILEMCKVYKAHRWIMLFHIYLPGLRLPILSGLTIAVGLSIRIVILAEVLGANFGIGHSFSLARVNLETAELYSWVLVCLIILGIIEVGLLKPFKRKVMTWKNPGN